MKILLNYMNTILEKNDLVGYREVWFIMSNIYLSYYTNDTKYCSQEELDMFFGYQDVIKEDLRRIYRIVESDYSTSEAKEHLLRQLKLVIRDIVRNRFEKKLKRN